MRLKTSASVKEGLEGRGWLYIKSGVRLRDRGLRMKLPEMRGTLHDLDLALAGATLLLLTPGLVDGSHCPLPEPSGEHSPHLIIAIASYSARVTHQRSDTMYSRTVFPGVQNSVVRLL